MSEHVRVLVKDTSFQRGKVVRYHLVILQHFLFMAPFTSVETYLFCYLKDRKILNHISKVD